MKKAKKILIGTIAMAILFTVFGANTVMAVEDSSIEINDDTFQTKIQANNRVMFTFRQRTRLVFDSTVDIDVDINCDAVRIGVKNFEIEVDCDQDLKMNMTCTEEQAELGLLMGNRYLIRQRNRFLYQEGFCISIECNNSLQVQAKLKIQANNQNRLATWAYYDENSEDWVTVPTTIEDGYLVANTDHFSYWTVLIPESNTTLLITIGLVGAIGIISVISGVTLRRRK
ncbi:MAG: hypothetical protein ACXAEX_23570 [Promethearchaeota archaeon]|jgi:hypothetical protein